MSRRIDIKALLSDPVKRRRMMALSLRATQAREGRNISLERAYEVYDKAQTERTSP